MKRKTSILINIASLSLCLACLVIGVLSAKRVTANLSGSIGFTAYNCEVQFAGSITGAVLSTAQDNKVDSLPMLYIHPNDEPSPSSTGSTFTIGGDGQTTTSNVKFGNIAFAVNNSSYLPYDIEMTFTLTNMSAFDVCASLSLENFNINSNISYTANEYKLKLGTTTSTKTKSFTITLKTGNNSFTSILNSSIINLTFEKFNVPIAEDVGFTVVDASKEWNNYIYNTGYYISGVPAGTGEGTLTIPAYFSDDSGELIKIYGLYNDGNQLNGLKDAKGEDTDYSGIAIQAGITRLGNKCFKSTSALTSIVIADSVTTVDNAFDSCANLASIKMSTNIQYICGSDFADTAYINNVNSSITTPDYVEDNVIYFTDSLDGKGTKLVAGLAINKSISSATIADTTKVIAVGAFQECSELTSITIPNSVTIIGDKAFSGCTILESITIPNGVTRIAYGLFNSCECLTSIIIPSSVTSIGECAFYSSGLTSITIPSSVTSIESCAFYDCTGLNLTFTETKTWEYSDYSSFPSGSTSTVTLTAGEDYSDYFTANSGTYDCKYWRVKPE